MYDTATILVIFGSLLFILALLGGGITVKEIKVPPIQSRIRIFLYPVSIAFIVGGVWLSRQPPPTSLLPTVEPTLLEEIAQSSLDRETQAVDNFGCYVWKDDFSQISGWGNDELDWGSWGHENGEYRMSLYNSQSLSLRCALCDGLNYQSFQVSVTARTPQSKGSWGIYFWGKEKSRFSLELDKDGNALIKQYDDFDMIILGSQQTDVKATSEIRVEYQNGKIDGYINGAQVLTVPMSSPPVFGNYGVGLIQASLFSDSAETFFDDFSFSGCP
jgi:hypothetical protein